MENHNFQWENPRTKSSCSIAMLNYQRIPSDLTMAQKLTYALWHTSITSHCIPWYFMIFHMMNTLWWTNIALEHHHFLRENPLFLWPFSIAMLVHQRVSVSHWSNSWISAWLAKTSARRSFPAIWCHWEYQLIPRLGNQPRIIYWRYP